jgi:hypothetical protein
MGLPILDPSNGDPAAFSPEDCLASAERLLESGAPLEAHPELATAIRQLTLWVRSARVDAAADGSYAGSGTTDRISALLERIARVIARLEAARREVEDELRSVRSQRAFERQEKGAGGTWFEARA